jgi:L-threonylcarbamoyladenylate synthase
LQLRDNPSLADAAMTAIGTLGKDGSFSGGALVGFPTETFYGLGADPWDREAVKALFALKGRAADSPVALIAADLEAARRVGAKGAFDAGTAAERLARAFWPGPLTIVVPAHPDLPAELTAGTGTIGVRVSSHPIAAKLAAERGAITATSANPSGKPPVTTAAEVSAYFPGLPVVDGGTTPGGPPSTVLDCTADPPRIVRAGAVALEALRGVVVGIVG